MPAIQQRKMSKVLIATYTAYNYFVIPPALAKIIDNKDYVESYYVKWDTLYIDLTNGETIEIQMKNSCDPDYKYPEETKIEDLEDHPYLQK